MATQISRRQLVATVSMTLAVQALTSVVLITPSVLAPVAAQDIGADPIHVGLFVSTAYLGAMLSGVFCSSLIVRLGPVRMMQIAVLAAGLGLLAGSGATVPLVLLMAALAGAAHGTLNPATAQILAEASPPTRRGLIFSIKQTGVPVGNALAGLLLPAMLLVTGWRSAVLAIVLACVLMPLAISPFRRLYDQRRKPEHRIVLSAIFAPVFEVWALKPILELALMSGVFSAVQLCVFTYLISYLALELGFSLILAGVMFSVAQGAGIVGRVFWGYTADRLLPPRLVLALLGIGMSLCGVATMLFSAAWPPALIMLVCALYGATAVGWNGVYLAEVVRLAPEGKVGMLTGGGGFFTFFGALCGPPIFGAVVSLGGSYAHGFVLFTVLPMIFGLRLLLAREPAAAIVAHRS